MKKKTRILIIAVAAFLVLVCALTLPKCINAFRTLGRFSVYLDEEGFVPPMHQLKLMDMLENYRYEGESVTDLCGKVFMDGHYGGGVSGYATNFGYNNNFILHKTETGRRAMASNGFYTQVPLEGLAQPFGIPFGTTLTAILQELGIYIDPEKNFVSDRGNEGVMTLYVVGSESLTLTDNLRLPEESRQGNWRFQLTYTSSYPSEQRGGDAVVKRVMLMQFAGENNQFSRLEMGVYEEYTPDY